MSRSRIPALLLLFGCLALGALVELSSATAAPETTIPPIRESFAHHRCSPRTDTTLAQEACVGDQVLRLDAHIDSLDSQIAAGETGAERVVFARAVRGWIEYRDDFAVIASGGPNDGSSNFFGYVQVLRNEDQAQIAALNGEFQIVSH